MRRRGRARRVPEVVQISAMDCGPAAAAALLAGFGIPCHIETLRARCATDIDGTSIDALETELNELGLPVEQIVVPVDHLLLAEAAVLPAIVVVLQPDGATHFVVVWRRHGRHRLEIMDPAVGRRIVRAADFLATVYRHPFVVPEEAWFDWATGPEGGGALRARLTALGVAPEQVDALVNGADEPTRLAALDAAARVVARLRTARAVSAGDAANLLDRLLCDPDALPDTFRSVTRTDPPEEEEGQWLVLRGAVAARVTGPPPAAAAGTPTPAVESWARVARELWTVPASRAAAALSVLAGLAFVAEAWALQGLLAAPGPRAFGLAISVVGAELAVGWAAAAAARAAGRGLEQRARDRWTAHLARTPASWVGTRPASDLVERVHGLHRARALPQLCGVALRAAGAGLGAAAAVVAVLPAAAPAVLLLLTLPVIGLRRGWAGVLERDLRARSLAGSLSRFVLDALLGLTAVRSHTAERALRWEHGRVLAQWRTAARRRVRAVASVELAVGLAVLLPAAALLAVVAGATLPAPSALMVLLLGLSIPMAVDELMAAGRLLPDARNRLLRFLEILDAAAEPSTSRPPPPAPGGAEVVWSDVTVARGGHPVITGLTLRVAAGERVAVVGRSGSAKSTLLDTLVGLVDLVTGTVTVDGVSVASDPAHIRAITAWASAGAALWDRGVDENVCLPAGPDPDVAVRAARAVGADVVHARVGDPGRGVGAGGRLLSGGEGQLLRAARAAHASPVRLLLGDEATRGLDRAARRRVLDGLCAANPAATVLWVTHDPAEAAGFDRVVVLAAGTVVEDGAPAVLVRAGGAFSELYAAAAAADGPDGWRCVALEDCTEAR